MQYLHFKESEIPLKENEKTKIKHLYKMLEVCFKTFYIHFYLFMGLNRIKIFGEDLEDVPFNDTGVDRVWSHSFAGGLPPQRCGEGMGQVDRGHA